MNRRILILSLLCCAALLTEAATAQPVVRFVDKDATGANNGTNWTDAYVDVQPALVDLSATEVRVAQGTYWPSSPGITQQNWTFTIRNGLKLLGGYAGFSNPNSDLDERDGSKRRLHGGDTQQPRRRLGRRAEKGIGR